MELSQIPEKKRRTRKPRPANELSHPIDELYDQQVKPTRGTSHTKHKIERGSQKKSSFLFISGLVILLISGLVWLGFFLIGSNNRFDDSKIDLSVDSPDKIVSGDPLDMVIHYTNNTGKDLASSSIRVKTPEGFKLASSEPKANGTNEYHFLFGTLHPKDTGKIVLHGIFYGKLEEEKQGTIYFDYRPENFNADFEKILTKSIRATSIPVELSVTRVGADAAGTPGTYTITVKNTSATPRGPYKLALSLPDDFVISDSKPKLSSDNSIITPILLSGTPFVTTISGAYKSSSQGEMKMNATLFAVVDDKEFAQVTVDSISKIEASPLTIDIQLGDTKKKGSVAPGDTIQTHINVTNKGQNTLSDIVLTMEVEAPSFNNQSIIKWDAINDPWEGTISAVQVSPEIRTATVVWTGKQIEHFKSLAPGKSFEFEVDLPLKNLAQFGTNKLPTKPILAHLIASYPGAAPLGTSPIELNFRSDTKITTLVTPVGEPITGKGSDNVTETTTRSYDITTTISNALHELGSLELIATLPQGVVFEKVATVPAGELSYVDSTRTVRWTLNKLPTSIPSLTFSFRVKTTTAVGDPEPNELTGEGTLAATDATTHDIFVVKIPIVKRK